MTCEVFFLILMRIYQISAFFTGFQSSYIPILDINVRCLVPSASILTRDFLFLRRHLNHVTKPIIPQLLMTIRFSTQPHFLLVRL